MNHSSMIRFSLRTESLGVVRGGKSSIKAARDCKSDGCRFGNSTASKSMAKASMAN